MTGSATRRLNLGTGVAAAGLIGLLALELADGVAGGTGRAASAPGPSPTAAAQGLGPLSAYAEVIQRPLFDRSRRPPPAFPVVAAPLPQPAAAPSPPAVELIGVAVSGPQRYALIRPVGGSSRLVAEGDSVDGWQVQAVAPGRMVLARGDQRAEIGLIRRGPVAPPAAQEPWQMPGGHTP